MRYNAFRYVIFGATNKPIHRLLKNIKPLRYLYSCWSIAKTQHLWRLPVGKNKGFLKEEFEPSSEIKTVGSVFWQTKDKVPPRYQALYSPVMPSFICCGGEGSFSGGWGQVTDTDCLKKHWSIWWKIASRALSQEYVIPDHLTAYFFLRQAYKK